MIKLFKITILTILTVTVNVSSVFAYHYEVQKNETHIVHIVTIDPNKYDIDFVKARNAVIGRETVPDIAERTNSDIAINAGFFEIGYGADGMPSRNLIIDGEIYGLKSTDQSVVMKNKSGRLNIKTVNSKIILMVDQQKLQINKINQPPSQKELVLFTNNYGSSTLTSFRKRQEVSFDLSGNILAVYNHGNTSIPSKGYTLSIPKSFTLDITNKSKIVINTNFNLEDSVSMVTGIPILIKNKGIVKNLYQKKSSFYLGSHARTAIGYKEDGTIIIVIAEHIYKRNLSSITWGEVNSIMKLKNKEIYHKYNKNAKDITLSELKELLEKEFTSQDNTQGLSMLELAQLMKTLDCYSAINLDGGGSTTLWLEGKVINKTSGDLDEGNGMKILRPVSDAIVFRKKIIS